MKILLIEDDDMTRELLTEELTSARYAVEAATDGELGLELASLWVYDLIVLDLQIPKLDGLNVCRQLRNRGITTPILILTAQDAQEDIVTGLDTGADDYVTKPFQVCQVLARIRALLRRGSTTTDKAPALSWGKLSLDPATAHVTYGDQVIDLTPKEYSLLELFLRNPRRVFSRSTILDHLWTIDDYPTEGAVTNLVKDLRNRLKRSGIKETVIQTVYGLGYRLRDQTSTPNVEASQAPSPPGAEASPRARNKLDSIAVRFQSSIQQRVNVLEDAVRALQAGGISASQRTLAREEAHRLAGGLGTFGYEEGSASARQIEQLLQSDEPLGEETVAILSQQLLALKKAVAGQPNSPKQKSETVPLPSKRLITLFLLNDVLLSLQALGPSYGWVIEAYADLETALDRSTDSAVDAILIEFQSRQDSAQILAALGELKHHWPEAPLVVMSHHENLAERVKAVRLGAERYLVAPLDPERLLETLTNLATPPADAESKILVVDHDPAVCATISELLTPWGLQVTTLGDSKQFWEVLRQTNPDLLLLARDLPTFSGVDLCQVVRKDGRYGNLPILMMTTHANKMSVQQLFELGCDDLVHKPIISPELITRVLSRIERSRLRRQLELMRQQQAVYWQRQEQCDPLTGMANARYFDQFLQQQWERHRQEKAPIALILCVPDGFNTYQKTYGQQAAERRLRQITQMLQSTINPNIDLTCRYSNEAFAIVLPNTNLEGAQRVVNRIRRTVQQNYAQQGATGSCRSLKDVSIALSIGVGATIPNARQPCDDLLKMADQALKEAQLKGGDTFCVCPV